MRPIRWRLQYFTRQIDDLRVKQVRNPEKGQQVELHVTQTRIDHSTCLCRQETQGLKS